MYFIPEKIMTSMLFQHHYITARSFTQRAKDQTQGVISHQFEAVNHAPSVLEYVSEDNRIEMKPRHRYVIENKPRKGFKFLNSDKVGAEYLHPLGFVFRTTPGSINYLAAKDKAISEQELVIVFSKSTWYLVNVEDLADMEDFRDTRHPKYPLHQDNLVVGQYYSHSPDGREACFYVGTEWVNGHPIQIFMNGSPGQYWVAPPALFHAKKSKSSASVPKKDLEQLVSLTPYFVGRALAQDSLIVQALRDGGAYGEKVKNELSIQHYDRSDDFYSDAEAQAWPEYSANIAAKFLLLCTNTNNEAIPGGVAKKTEVDSHNTIVNLGQSRLIAEGQIIQFEEESFQYQEGELTAEAMERFHRRTSVILPFKKQAAYQVNNYVVHTDRGTLIMSRDDRWAE